MQSSIAHRSLAACPVQRNRFVPARCKLASNRIGPKLLSAAIAGTPEQPATSTSTPSSEAGTKDAAVVVGPALVAKEVVSTSGHSDAVPDPNFPELPLSTNRAAGTQYLAIGAAYAVAAGAVAVAALQGPQLLLASPAAADPWSSVLLGCVAATYLRAAGVFLQLKAASDAAELLCWRHQRLALTAAAYGMVAVLTQAAGLASPQLLGLQLLLSVASAAVVANVARSAWAVRPFVSSLTEGRSPGGVLAAVAGAMTGSVSTVAGLLLTTTIVVSLYGLFAAVFAPAPALPVAPPPATTLPPAPAHRDMAAPRIRTLKYFLPNPTIYSLLNLGFVAAAVLQSYFLYIAPAWGVNVNWDTALWGPMYGTAFLGLVYGLVALTKFDWSSVVDAVLRVACWFAELTMWFWDTFVWKFSWSEKTRRA
eukprot:XP_001695697.1 predicted protein [Chlamydomonas reinhardtii]